jgi:hypothetical protein
MVQGAFCLPNPVVYDTITLNYIIPDPVTSDMSKVRLDSAQGGKYYYTYFIKRVE